MKISSKLSELKPIDLNCNVFDVYSCDGLSMQELLCQFFTKINECIKVSNETIDLASWLVNEGLKIEVVNKLMLWLNDGTLENIINVNLFNTLHNKIENKVSYFTLKEFKNNNLSDEEALQECINYICNNRIISTDMEYQGVSAGGTVIDLCGCEIILDKSLNIANGDTRYSDITFQNGTLKASETFKDEYMLLIGKYSHNRGLKFYNITFNCNLKCSPFFMQYTLNTLFSGCTFTNMNKPAKVLSYQTHETIFNNCYFSNINAVNNGYDYIDCALELGVDGHVSNCNFIGFKNGIDCLGGCNMISNNHFYGIKDYGIITREGAVLNNIYGNYFDECSIYTEREYGDINVVSNVFLQPKYSAGVHSKYLLKRTNISNNTYRFTSEKRNRLLGVGCTIENNILTTTTDVFNKYDVGAVNETGTLTIIGYIDSRNVKVSYDNSVVKEGQTTVWLFPTNVSSLAQTKELKLNSTATTNENIIDGVLPNNATKRVSISSDIVSGWNDIKIDRITGLKYITNSCYTLSNQAQKTSFSLGTLPKEYYPSSDTYVSVLVVNANNSSEVLGTCTALISSSNGGITLYKKQGDFNLNNVEYKIKTYYK